MATPDKGVYVANTSFASSFPTGEKDENGTPLYAEVVALVGKRYRGDHPLVKLAPNYFDAEGVASPVIEAATVLNGIIQSLPVAAANAAKLNGR